MITSFMLIPVVLAIKIFFTLTAAPEIDNFTRFSLDTFMYITNMHSKTIFRCCCFVTEWAIPFALVFFLMNFCNVSWWYLLISCNVLTLITLFCCSFMFSVNMFFQTIFAPLYFLMTSIASVCNSFMFWTLVSSYTRFPHWLIVALVTLKLLIRHVQCLVSLLLIRHMMMLIMKIS